jgi:hypothetical protein
MYVDEAAAVAEFKIRMTTKSLILKRATASRSSGQWSDADFDVLDEDGAVVGRIFLSPGAQRIQFLSSVSTVVQVASSAKEIGARLNNLGQASSNAAARIGLCSGHARQPLTTLHRT